MALVEKLKEFLKMEGYTEIYLKQSSDIFSVYKMVLASELYDESDYIRDYQEFLILIADNKDGD